MMSVSILAVAASQTAISTQGPVPTKPLRPAIPANVGIAALFFLFTREITRLVQLTEPHGRNRRVFYTPSIVQTMGMG
jgi:hypothetical protein